MLVGAHIPNADPLREAEIRGADLAQFFLGNPQSWKKPNPRPDAEELLASPMPLYVHAPYLINVCASESRIRIPSRRILQESCDAAAAIGARGVVVHGGHVTGEGTVEDAFVRWRKALEELDSAVPVLIENTAGGPKAVVRSIDVIARLWTEIGDLQPGFVLDTCHAWASGEPLDGLVDRVMAATGRIDLVHCNDSRDPFDSRRDRHVVIGQGEIPLDLLAAVIRQAQAPVVTESPGDAEAQAGDIAWVKRVAGDSSP